MQSTYDFIFVSTLLITYNEMDRKIDYTYSITADII